MLTPSSARSKAVMEVNKSGETELMLKKQEEKTKRLEQEKSLMSS